jgi:hypothetical protein
MACRLGDNVRFGDPWSPDRGRAHPVVKRTSLFIGLGLVPVTFLGLALAALVPACGSQTGDSPAPEGTPSALGNGLRVRDVMNPNAKTHPDTDGGAMPSVTVTGASVSWIDTYDETANGKSIGTVYVQDVASQAPYSGGELYNPDYFPASLAPAPGDVLDLVGDFEELTHLGTANFDNGTSLPEFDQPNATFRYEYDPPVPVIIQPSDLADYEHGRRYLDMLVTIQNVTLTAGFTNSSGRVTAPFTDIQQDGPTIANENVAIDPSAYSANQTFTSVTGIVTWFFNFQVAPRTLDDLKTQ